MTANKQSLISMLRMMQDFDDGISDLSLDDITSLVEDLTNEKVDGCQKFLTHIQSRIDVVDGEIKELQASKKSMQNSLKNYKKYLDYAMDSTGTKKLPGKFHTLYRTERKNIQPVEFELSSQHYIDFNSKLDGVVDRKYALNKTKFKKMVELNPELYDEYAVETTTTAIQFRVNKGVDK